MRKILGLLFISSSIFSMQLGLVKSDEKKVHIPPTFVFVPSRLGPVDLYHGKKGFSVIHENKKHKIESPFTDPMVRNITPEQLKAFLNNGRLSINQTTDGTFLLKANTRTVGGGIIGANIGAFLGKATVYVLGHGAIQIAALCTGPAYPATVLALEGCFAIQIEAASMGGAIAGGMIGAVTTGPV